MVNFETQIKRKESNKKYYNTEYGKQKILECNDRYQKTDNGKQK